MKFFYFVAVLSDVIFSVNKGKNCFHFITILYGELCILYYIKNQQDATLAVLLVLLMMDAESIQNM